MTFLPWILVPLLLVILYAVPTWSKRRQLMALLGAVNNGRVATSWIYSDSTLEGRVAGRAVRIENPGMTRGVFVFYVEQGSSVRAEAIRKTHLRAGAKSIGWSQGMELRGQEGAGVLIRLTSSHRPAKSEEVKDLIVRIFVEYPDLDRVIVSESRLVVFRDVRQRRNLEPGRVRNLLEDLCSTARRLESVSAVTNHWTERIDSILEPLLRTHESLRRGLVGCSEEDVAMIESEFGHPLPAAFVALLGRFGRSRGQLMKGADFSFPEILHYRGVADSLLSDLEEDLELDECDFVFWMEQGYQFFFFRAGESDDPAIFLYDDDSAAFKKISDSLTEWLRICIQEEIDLRAGRVPGQNRPDA